MNKAKWLGFGVGGLIGSFVAEGLYKTIMQLKTHKIDLKISKAKQTGSIQPIEIDLSKENKPQTIPEEEILELKKFLKENYAAEEININE